MTWTSAISVKKQNKKTFQLIPSDKILIVFGHKAGKLMYFNLSNFFIWVNYLYYKLLNGSIILWKI